jgi:hypothetical protein
MNLPVILNITLKAPQESSYSSNLGIQYYAVAQLDQPERPNIIQLPKGFFNIKDLFKRFGENWRPDIIMVSSTLLGSPRLTIPQGLGKLNIPSILKLSDSHHMFQAIRSNIKFSRLLNCHYHYTTYNRQHIHFYRQQGLENVIWLPGSLAINPKFLPVKPEKEQGVVFCGSYSSVHPYRAALLKTLQHENIDLQVKKVSYQQTLEEYNKSVISFNCSLNGDLNRRVFETIMAGGFLLTDRLAPEAGLNDLFLDSIHYSSYISAADLLDKTSYYLSSAGRRDALEIATKGQAEFFRKYHPEILTKQLYNFLLKGSPLPETFLARKDNRSFAVKREHIPGDKVIAVYETIQEIHRLNSKIRVLNLSNSESINAAIQDLPRLEIVEEARLIKDQVDVIIVGDIRGFPLALESFFCRSLCNGGIIIFLEPRLPQQLKQLISAPIPFKEIFIQDVDSALLRVYQKPSNNHPEEIKITQLTSRNRLKLKVKRKYFQAVSLLHKLAANTNS